MSNLESEESKKYYYKNFKIVESKESDWCTIHKDGKFKARTIDVEEARRYIWLSLIGTADEIEYLSQNMLSA